MSYKRKKKQESWWTELKEGFIVGAFIALCFIVPQTAKNIQYYNEYKVAVEKGYETESYDSFWDFLQNWDGEISQE